MPRELSAALDDVAFNTPSAAAAAVGLAASTRERFRLCCLDALAECHHAARRFGCAASLFALVERGTADRALVDLVVIGDCDAFPRLEATFRGFSFEELTRRARLGRAASLAALEPHADTSLTPSRLFFGGRGTRPQPPGLDVRVAQRPLF